MNLNQQQTAYLSDTYNRMEQKFRAECHRMNGRIPYISIDGAYPTWDESMINWWTNGFWGGIMWQLYHAENNSDYMSEANCLEEHLEKAEKMMDDCAEVICCVDKFGTMNAANRRLVEKAKRDGKLKTE